MEKKNVKKIVVGLGLAGAMLIAGTYAYLTRETQTLANNFTFVNGDDLKATLSEPNWVEDNAKNLLPNAVVAKDPTISNIDVNDAVSKVDEWVGAKITFCYGPAAKTNAGKQLSATDLAIVLNAITIDWNADKTAGATWTRFDSNVEDVCSTYYFNTKLGKDTKASTDPLFTKITIKDNDNTTMKALDEMGGFQIFVEGAAVQADANLDTALKGSAQLTFSNTPSIAS